MARDTLMEIHYIFFVVWLLFVGTVGWFIGRVETPPNPEGGSYGDSMVYEDIMGVQADANSQGYSQKESDRL